MNETYHNALPAGTRIDSYEIQDILGVGGFGVTYKGYDHDLHCFVAIKEYLPEGLALRADGTTVIPRSENDKTYYQHGLKRFLEEARILARFKERSIVRVTRFLEANGTGYLLMDYEEGESLAQLLQRCGILNEQEVYAILVPVLHGLRTVHAAGIMHRDIKPGNIFLRKDGSPVLLDFGAARQALSGQTVALTQIVTPGYGPFEQYGSSERQGPWTDLYALGATLYHCIAGKAPPKAPDRIAALHDGAPDPIKPAIEIGAGRYNKTLLELIDAMLAPLAKDRPQSADDALARLQQIENAPAKSETGASAIPKTVVLAQQPATAHQPTIVLPSTEDQTKEFNLCHRLAEQGDTHAQYELGMRYAHGRGCTHNGAAALQWLEKAANKDHLLAQNHLGIMLARGAGVAKDETAAAEWLRKAAESGDAAAQFNYGMLCAHGLGVAQDTTQAIEWYAKAARQGHAGAQSNLDVLAADQNGWKQWGIAGIILLATGGVLIAWWLW